MENAAGNGTSRRDALKKGAAFVGTAGVVWSAPRVEGLSLRPNYAAASSGPCSPFNGTLRVSRTVTSDTSPNGRVTVNRRGVTATLQTVFALDCAVNSFYRDATWTSTPNSGNVFGVGSIGIVFEPAVSSQSCQITINPALPADMPAFDQYEVAVSSSSQFNTSVYSPTPPDAAGVDVTQITGQICCS